MKLKEMYKDLKLCGDYIQNGYFCLEDFGKHILNVSKKYDMNAMERQKLETVAFVLTERKRENDEREVIELNGLLANLNLDNAKKAIDLIFCKPTWKMLEGLSMLVDNGYITASEVLEKAFETQNLELIMRISIVIRGVNYDRIAHFFSEAKDPMYILEYARIMSYLPIDYDMKNYIVGVLYKGIKDCNMPKYMSYFAKYVKGTSIKDTALALLESDDVATIYYFVRDNYQDMTFELLRKFAYKIINLGEAMFINFIYKLGIISLEECLYGMACSNVKQDSGNRLLAFTKRNEDELKEMHYYALEYGGCYPFELIAMGLIETSNIREMIKFICDYDLAPYQMIVDRIAELDPKKLIDVIEFGNYGCKDYAIERLICEWNFDLVEAAKEVVEDPNLLEKLDNASTIMAYGLPREKRNKYFKRELVKVG